MCYIWTTRGFLFSSLREPRSAPRFSHLMDRLEDHQGFLTFKLIANDKSSYIVCSTAYHQSTCLRLIIRRDDAVGSHFRLRRSDRYSSSFRRVHSAVRLSTAINSKAARVRKAAPKDGASFFIGVIKNGRRSKAVGRSAIQRNDYRKDERAVKTTLARVL